MKFRNGLILLLIFVLGLQTAGLTAQAASQKRLIFIWMVNVWNPMYRPTFCPR